MVPVFSQDENPEPTKESANQDQQAWCASVAHWITAYKAGEVLAQTIRNDWPLRERAIRAMAEKGDPAANNAIGVVLAVGPQGNPDPAAAIPFFERAAEAGHPVAATNLGRVYMRGIGVAQSLEKAMMWNRKGAAWEHPSPMRSRPCG